MGRDVNVERRRRRILVVDDDRAVCESLSRILEMRGYVADTAGTGREALGKSKRKHYSLVLINYRLPDMTSEQLQTTMLASTPKPKIVVMKANLFKPEKLLDIIEEKLQE